jgi:serine/threonine protein kinase
MLKKSPQERISAKEAISHPYFAEMDDDDEETDIVPVLNLGKQMSPSIDSPLLTTANASRKEEKLTKKDSCV